MEPTDNLIRNNRRISISRNTFAAALLALAATGCMVYEQSVRTAIDGAVSSAFEQELGARLAGYTDVMMYQLAYTQTFFLGGYGFAPDTFEEGQGATWRVESEDREQVSSFTAERALLKRNEDGSTWWFLKFDADDTDPLMFEVLYTANLEAREMYVRDPDTREVRHHIFTHDVDEVAEAEEGDESLEEFGYQTNYFHAESWDQYRQDRETITTRAGTFDTDLLFVSTSDIEEYEGYDEDDTYDVEYRWWVSRDVPGELVRFEYRDLESEGTLRGELIEFSDDYRPRFFDL